MRVLLIRAAGTGLGLAAAPTFALMAWVAATGEGRALCASSSGGWALDGMSAMYLLMSLFHLPPWLRLASPST